jgi:hypothetical protein
MRRRLVIRQCIDIDVDAIHEIINGARGPEMVSKVAAGLRRAQSSLFSLRIYVKSSTRFSLQRREGREEKLTYRFLKKQITNTQFSLQRRQARKEMLLNPEF